MPRRISRALQPLSVLALTLAISGCIGTGGIAPQGKALDANGVKSLASIPSKEVLLAQICGLLQSPISGLARVLAAVGEQKGGGAAAPAEAEAPAA